jgi:hypothetical protein
VLSIFVSCEREEPVPPQQVAIKLNVTENFWKYKYNYIAILSDFEGNVLVIDYLNYKGAHELMLPQPVDGTFHLTLFDGYTSFTTYAFLPLGDYILDFKEPQYYNNAGKHALFFPEQTVQPSGKDIYFSYLKTANEAELWMSNAVSDLYLYYERPPNNSPGYVYLPEIRVNESTSIDANVDGKNFEQLPVSIQNSSGTNIFLYGDNDADEETMRYILSRSGPLPAGPATMNVPKTGEPQVSHYRTVFSSFDGNTYTHTGETIATVQKQLIANIQNLETNAFSAFYTIAGEVTAVDLSASGTNFSWRILSPPGINIKINLPKLPLEFRNGYDLNMMGTLEFSTANLLKDSRFPTYMDLVREHFLRDQHPQATPYELIEKSVSAR